MTRIIDIFAGPGGLSEGFSSVLGPDGERAFDVCLSIEKDSYAFQTLKLRTFFRAFPLGSVPSEYYAFLQGKLSVDKLFDLYPEQASIADREAWCAALGDDENCPYDELDNRIQNALDGDDPWVLIGGPPCQAYSLVGRARNKGKIGYTPEEDERHFLYREYLRIIGAHSPAAFVMENVKGILSSRVNQELIFERILSDIQFPFQALREEGIHVPNRFRYRLYSVVTGEYHDGDDHRNFTVKAEDYGIAQARHRVIIVGIREDIENGIQPLEKVDRKEALRPFLAGIPKVRSGLSREPDSLDFWKKRVQEALGADWLGEVKQKCGEDVYEKITESLNVIAGSNMNRGGEFVRTRGRAAVFIDWFHDERMNGVCNHTTRGHIAPDLHRYLFVSAYTAINGVSPKLHDFPESLLPKHKNAKSGAFCDRFRAQGYEGQATTVTCHISKDGHYFIHPDPTQCRSLTVREAARIQTFPDNYFFCGPRTSQYTQVGNAVPPLLARRIADSLSSLFD